MIHTEQELTRNQKMIFRGETSGMNGHVFQTFGESHDKRQYTKTLEALERHISRNCKFAEDLDDLFKMNNPQLTAPFDISSMDVSDPVKLLKWTEETKTHFQREQAMKDNLRDIHSIIWNQCSPSLQSKIKQKKDFVEIDNLKDCAWLLKSIKHAIYKFDSKSDPFLSIVEARASLEYSKQHDESEEEFYDTFRSHVEAFEHFGGSIGNNKGLIEELKDDTDSKHPGDMPETSIDDIKAWLSVLLNTKIISRKRLENTTLQ